MNKLLEEYGNEVLHAQRRNSIASKTATTHLTYAKNFVEWCNGEYHFDDSGNSLYVSPMKKTAHRPLKLPIVSQVTHLTDSSKSDLTLRIHLMGGMV